jgi:hypothetical protein
VEGFDFLQRVLLRDCSLLNSKFRAASMDPYRREHQSDGNRCAIPQAATAFSSGDDFQNGQKTPCLRMARTMLTASAAGWFSNVR